MALVPVRQETVNFYGDLIVAAEGPEAEVYVPLRPICDALGLAWAAQRIRLNRDPILVEAQRSVIVTITEGYPRAMLCLPLDLLPGWLFGISAARVKPALQEKITRYRRECFRVLWTAFKGAILPTAPLPPADFSPAEQALALAEAVASLARSHLEQTTKIEEIGQRQQVMADYLRPFVQRTNERLTAIELQLSGGATISEAQAAELALAVKNVAMLLAANGDANGFGRVWGDLYRRYRIGAYRNLPAARFEEALTWLREWYGELAKPDTTRV